MSWSYTFKSRPCSYFTTCPGALIVFWPLVSILYVSRYRPSPCLFKIPRAVTSGATSIRVCRDSLALKSRTSSRIRASIGARESISADPTRNVACSVVLCAFDAAYWGLDCTSGCGWYLETSDIVLPKRRISIGDMSCASYVRPLMILQVGLRPVGDSCGSLNSEEEAKHPDSASQAAWCSRRPACSGHSAHGHIGGAHH